MFRVVRGKAIRCQQDSKVPLIRVDSSCANAGVRIHASQCELLRSQLVEELLKVGSEESAIAFLCYDGVLVVTRQV